MHEVQMKILMSYHLEPIISHIEVNKNFLRHRMIPSVPAAGPDLTSLIYKAPTLQLFS